MVIRESFNLERDDYNIMSLICLSLCNNDLKHVFKPEVVPILGIKPRSCNAYIDCNRT